MFVTRSNQFKDFKKCSMRGILDSGDYGIVFVFDRHGAQCRILFYISR